MFWDGEFLGNKRKIFENFVLYNYVKGCFYLGRIVFFVSLFVEIKRK